MTIGQRLLLLDAVDASRHALAQELALHAQCQIVQAANVNEARALLEREAFDAVIVDAVLPDMGGTDFCRLLRRQKIRCPTLVLGDGGDAEIILALDSGANDYITRPFGTALLLARLRAHLRQHEESDDATLPLGRFLFRPGAKLLLDPGAKKKMRLTDLETAMLKYLYRAGDRATSREKLLAEVWGYKTGVSTHTIESHVHRLRRKIERDPRRAEILLTEAGGYRLAGVRHDAAA